MPHELNRSATALALIMSCALLLISCGDSPSNRNDGAQGKSPPPANDFLNKEVGSHALENGIASEIFKNQAARKSNELSALWESENGHFKLPTLFTFFKKESLQLQDIEPETLAKYVIVEQHRNDLGEVKWLTIHLKGSDSSRRLFLVNGGMKRNVAPGCGSLATEVAAALEVMRIFISRRAMGKTPALPFDLEYVFCATAENDMGFVSRFLKNEVVLGVICVEEMTPKTVGASNIVVHVVDQEGSTIANALSGAVLHFAGGRAAWQKGSVSTDLPKIAKASYPSLKQRFLPYVVIRAASSAINRKIKTPTGVKSNKRAQSEIDPIHTAVGTAEDKLDLVSDRKFTTTVAMARAIAIGITRCRAALTD